MHSCITRPACIQPVKMTELLSSVAARLKTGGEITRSTRVTAVATKYRAGELNYSEAMSRLTDAVGRPALVAEVCRLSQTTSTPCSASSAAAQPIGPPIGESAP